MAALRQLLNTRDMQGALYPRALPEESRQMVKAKMEAMGYPVSPQPPAVPEKEQSSKPSDYDTGLSLKPVRYQENAQPNYETDPHKYDRDTYTSMFEQRLSQDISSALSNHLAHRPRNPRDNGEKTVSSTIHEHRRRSRSAVQDAHDSNAWKDDKTNVQARHPPRRDSRSASQPPRHYREGSKPSPEMHEYTMSPEMDNGAFQPLAQIGHSNKKQHHSHHYQHYNHNSSSNNNNNNTARHSNTESTDRSPSNDIREGVKHSPAGTNQQPMEPSRKRTRSTDLDYTQDQLATKSYADLASEPFDHTPPSYLPDDHALFIQHLPSPNLALPSRLQAVFDTSANRTRLAKTLFASLTIDTYEECGDLLIERFSEIVRRLKEARQVKRKACRALEEEVALREGWVRRKRACVEGGLGRLRTTGMSVVRPCDGGGGRKP